MLSYMASLDLQGFLHEPRIAYLQINSLAQHSCELGQSSLPIILHFPTHFDLAVHFAPIKLVQRFTPPANTVTRTIKTVLLLIRI